LDFRANSSNITGLWAVSSAAEHRSYTPLARPRILSPNHPQAQWVLIGHYRHLFNGLAAGRRLYSAPYSRQPHDSLDKVWTKQIIMLSNPKALSFDSSYFLYRLSNTPYFCGSVRREVRYSPSSSPINRSIVPAFQKMRSES
jgi:hypothetical protein